MKKFLKSPLLTLLLFISAAILLVVGSVGTTQAALSRESEIYRTEMRLKNIGVALREGYTPDVESAVDISYRTYGTGTTGMWAKQHTGVLIEDMVKNAGDKELEIGKEYPIYLSVQNTGQVDEYVRLTLYKYWVDKNGNKIEYNQDTLGWFNGNGDKAVYDTEKEAYRIKYDPALIEITYDISGLWKLDSDASTDERLVFYYQDVLPKATNSDSSNGGKTAVAAVQGITINPSVLSFSAKDANGIYKYAYDGVGFVIEVQVDAVQASHKEQSIPSAWGVESY